MTTTVLDKAKRWARAIKRDVVALWIAARDPRTPLLPKIIAGAVAAYALSPVDLIPDFIPIVGYLDDLVLVPLGILLSVRLIPPPLMSQFREIAVSREGPPISCYGLAAIVAIWLAFGSLVAWYVYMATLVLLGPIRSGGWH